MTEKLRLYFVTGGMPEAIKSILEDNDMQEMEQIQQNILNAYQLDFSKHIKPQDIPKVRYSLRNLNLDDNLLNIPLFMADITEKILDISLSLPNR